LCPNAHKPLDTDLNYFLACCLAAAHTPSWPSVAFLYANSPLAAILLLPFAGHPKRFHQVAAPSRPKDLLLHDTQFLQHDISSAPGFHLPQGFGHAGAPVVVYHTNSSNQLALECHQE
jgi:hypothetical protein